MDERMAAIEQMLWARIRDRELAGGAVRNQLMYRRWPELAPGVVAYDDTSVTCLLGMYGHVWGEFIVGVQVALGITRREALQLECGFEEWRVEFQSPFYLLGRAIGQKLEDEESERRPHEQLHLGLTTHEGR